MPNKIAFKEHVSDWALRLKVKPCQIRVQEMTRKWGSCSTNGYVTFAVDLLTESREFQEYVIVHELLHLRIPNHGRLFASLIRAHSPQSRQFARQLGRKIVSEPNRMGARP